ncbi:hypothetical protein FB451DRAFT_453740 [Mycena latifolia]|nr:hypothetical protein FB451DRAFT_453740 [Mycena latifolia]
MNLFPTLGISAVYTLALCLFEIYLRDDFRAHMKDLRVLQGLNYLIRSDSTSLEIDVPSDGPPTRKKLWSRLIALFRRRSTGPIALPVDGDLLEMGAGAEDPTREAWDIPAELTQDVLHWSRLSPDWHTNKALWISTDTKERHRAIADAVSTLLQPSSGDTRTGIAIVDAGKTRSAFWPLVHGFASASPGYRAALGERPPPVLSENDVRSPIFHAAKADHSPYTYYAQRSDIITKLICNPLKNVYEAFTKESDSSDSDSDSDTAEPADPQAPTRIILIVHGIRNKEQAAEVYDTIDKLEVKLKKNYKHIGIVAISDSKLLRHVSDDDRVIMDYVCMLFVSDAGSIVYSGKNPAPPAFYENLFLLLVDGIHRTGGAKAEKLWNQLPELASLSEADPIDTDEDNSESTLLIFSALYKASQARTKILELLTKIRVISRSQINKRLLKDNAKIAGLLQRLFKLNSYKKDIPKLPREHAIAVLNLTHYTLDRGLPDKGVVQDYKKFSLRAHRLLNWLADYLRLLPEEIAVHGVVLLSEHPIKHGGFSNIYHGKYKDPDGEDVEVALKVLKIFEDQSDERRLLLHHKFTKEALVWHYLRHKNIVPFIGVDSTTFPSPARAMVSPWMPLGSVLKYMTEFSPSSMYAIELLYDIVQGLKYLHSVNVVHGDLCGRNILMDKNGRARLTDFGLAAFVESDATIKTSTRSGSARWMAPELLLPPPGVSFKRTTESDIWAFGCVCCEIWSEGDAPFAHISSDMGVVLAFSDMADTSAARPYLSRPCDKAGTLMPDVLWDLVQWCCKHEPGERPTVQVLADMLSDMKQEVKSQDFIDVEVIEIPIASGSGTSRQRGGRRSPSPSVDDVWQNLFPPSPSPSPIPLPGKGKGKGRVHFEDEYATVRFGPLDIDDDPEKIFSAIFEGLRDVVKMNVLVEPLKVDELNHNHLGLRFQSLMEANNFAMTWMFYRDRLEPFFDISATLMDGQ